MNLKIIRRKQLRENLTYRELTDDGENLFFIYVVAQVTCTNLQFDIRARSMRN